jgi:hypothetical protein
MAPLHITVHCTGDQQFNIRNVNVTDSIHKIKAMIQAVKGIPRAQQYLILGKHNGLEDHKQLKDYDVVENRFREWFVHMNLIWRNTDDETMMEIFVRELDGHSNLFWVRPADTVGTVKALVENRSGHLRKFQRLTFKDDVELEDNHTLAHYKIKRNSTLHLNFKQPTDHLQIIIATHDEETFKLSVKESDTIGLLKTMIAAKAGVHPNSFTLVEDGEEELLEDDDKTLQGFNDKVLVMR